MWITCLTKENISFTLDTPCKARAKVVLDIATSNGGFCLLRGAEMFNIRKRTAIAIVALVVLGNCPPIAAALPVANAPVVVIVDPLDKYRGATELSDTDLVDLLSAIGFEGKALKVAYAVAKKESNGRPLAYNGNRNTGDHSYGVFQINMIGSLGEARREKFDLTTNKDLFDPVRNVEIAFHMTNGGEDWSSWKVYPGQTNGARYESYLKQFPKN
jgi:hypothetical protein